ncbi:MAG TPA: pantetheine-phosphate adenylyltransferase [Actinomycetota bacterium]|nr:pantetheine-phosphate adenylyltransferase [Actinomycetota bacterium]
MPDIAIYPGTFDPITNGHLDIIERAHRHVKSLIVAVSQNPGKSPLFTLEERVATVEEVLNGVEGIEVATFDGLLVDFAQQRGARILVKGLRAVSDFEYEMQMAQMNQRLAAVDTLFMVANPTYSFLSSSLVKEVARFGGSVDGLVPPEVARRLKERPGGQG